MSRDASELARRLARDARHYLSNGRRQGRYWMVGDVRNTPGRSMFVRLSGPESGPGAAGHWTDAASAEYGDLLDVIRESCGFIDFRDVAQEARRFLSLPRRRSRKPVRTPVPAGSPEAAQRLFAMSQPIRRTLVATYLRNRGIKPVHDAGALRPIGLRRRRQLGRLCRVVGYVADCSQYLTLERSAGFAHWFNPKAEVAKHTN
jgi:hypothetical protein